MKHLRIKKSKAEQPTPHKAASVRAEATQPAAPKRLRIPKRHAVGFAVLETVQVQEVAMAESLPNHEGKVIVPPSAKKRSKKYGQKS